MLRFCWVLYADAPILERELCDFLKQQFTSQLGHQAVGSLLGKAEALAHLKCYLLEISDIVAINYHAVDPDDRMLQCDIELEGDLNPEVLRHLHQILLDAVAGLRVIEGDECWVPGWFELLRDFAEDGRGRLAGKSNKQVHAWFDSVMRRRWYTRSNGFRQWHLPSEQRRLTRRTILKSSRTMWPGDSTRSLGEALEDWKRWTRSDDWHDVWSALQTFLNNEHIFDHEKAARIREKFETTIGTRSFRVQPDWATEWGTPLGHQMGLAGICPVSTQDHLWTVMSGSDMAFVSDMDSYVDLPGFRAWDLAANLKRRELTPVPSDGRGHRPIIESLDGSRRYRPVIFNSLNGSLKRLYGSGRRTAELESHVREGGRGSWSGWKRKQVLRALYSRQVGARAELPEDVGLLADDASRNSDDTLSHLFM